MYTAPTDDMQFLIDDVLDVGTVLGELPHYADLGLGNDLTTALLDEAAKFAADVVSPLRRVGDAHPARCSDSAVTIPPGYGDAIQQLGAGGWVGISAPQDQAGRVCPSCLAPPPVRCGTVLTWRLHSNLFSAPAQRWRFRLMRMRRCNPPTSKNLLG